MQRSSHPMFVPIPVGLMAIIMQAATAAEPVLVVPGEPAPMALAVELAPDCRLKSGEVVRLVELGGADAQVLADVVPGVAADGTVTDRTRLATVIPAAAKKIKKRRFRLEFEGGGTAPAATFALADVRGKSLKMTARDKAVLTYNYGNILREELPETEHRRRRACYIHPVRGLHGEVLTDDFPEDHYHHHGIFWT
ncbi:MAG: DUF6807 family protein, partial [Pirellulales bacterium]